MSDTKKDREIVEAAANQSDDYFNIRYHHHMMCVQHFTLDKLTELIQAAEDLEDLQKEFGALDKERDALWELVRKYNRHPELQTFDSRERFREKSRQLLQAKNGGDGE